SQGAVAGARHNEVRVLPAGLHKLEVHRSHRRKVLIQDLLQWSSSYRHVAPDPPDQAQVRISVHVDPDVAQRAYALAGEQQDSVHEYYLRRLHVYRLLEAKVVHVV